MAASGEELHNIETDVGTLHVYTQGNRQPEVDILTLHDLGCNHKVFYELAKHPAFTNISKRARWIHIDIPGQEDDAADLPTDYNFPTMQKLGESLIQVLQHLKINQVVCLGEGAGANILARFAMKYDENVLGICLIQCTGTTAGFMETMKDKIITYKLSHHGMNTTTINYLETHRFGSDKCLPTIREKGEVNPGHKQTVDKMIEEFKKDLKTKINPKNLQKFVETFLYRTQLINRASELKCPVLLSTGSKSAHNHTVHTLHSALSTKVVDKSKIELVEIDGVANVLAQAPEKFVESFQYFLQGCGKMGHVQMHHVNRQGFRNRSMSMEEADLPRGADSLSSTPTRKYSQQYSSSPPEEGSLLNTPPQ
ncbi:uncharacterized protein ZK1073.1-like isoform X2 [Lineus longissimus]|uniref:uncharacterized protein ZK1073.1-like isoform X2 n=1 Tax=Lineus longissimus TaxID=88925 RepID=UPI002B4DF18B